MFKKYSTNGAFRVELQSAHIYPWSAVDVAVPVETYDQIHNGDTVWIKTSGRVAGPTIDGVPVPRPGLNPELITGKTFTNEIYPQLKTRRAKVVGYGS